MPVHDVPENPGGAGVLEDHVFGGERVVEKSNLLELEDDAVLVDQTFRGASGAT